MRNIILWSIPRSRSTAFERSVMQRQDINVGHELLSAPYLKKHKRIANAVIEASAQAVPISGEDSYQQTLYHLARRSGGKRLFSKELICFFDEQAITDNWLKQFYHVFLVRDPASALRSLWRVSGHGPTTYYDPDEVDFQKLARVYNRVCQVCGIDSTMVMDADDDLIDDTEITLRRFCQATDLPFSPAMLKWNAEPVSQWETWKGWHEDAANSSNFEVRAHHQTDVPNEISGDIKKRAAYLQPFHDAFKLQAALERFACGHRVVQVWEPIDTARTQLLLAAHVQLDFAELLEYSAAAASRDTEIVFVSVDNLYGAPAVQIEQASRSLDKLAILRGEGKIVSRSLLSKGITSRLQIPVHYLPPFKTPLPVDTPRGWGEWYRETMHSIYSSAQTHTEEKTLRANQRTRGSVDYVSFASSCGVLSERTPDMEALTDGVSRWTNAEFLRDIAKLSITLKHHANSSTSADNWVVIFANRSAHTVLAMGGCLQAGTPFLEVPIWYSEDHVKQIFDRIKPMVVLTDENASSKLPKTIDQIDLKKSLSETAPALDWEMQLALSSPPVTLWAKPRHLAHGVLTSGTTSFAKLVEIPNSQVYDSLMAFSNYISTGDRIGLNAWLSCYIFYPPLLGATSVVVPDDVIVNPQSLLHFVKRERLTQLMVTPSLLEGLVSLGDKLSEAFASVHTLWISGEALPKQLWQDVAKVLPSAKLLNLLGINETGDVGIAHNASGWFNLLPGIKVYVLDDEGRIVPDHVVGELHVASHGLSSGYFADPGNTDKFFVSNPYANLRDDEPDMLYRSGDQVRRNKQGQISFVGRGSAHLKVRGYKVDPSRVESVLTSHAEIQSAVVQTRGSGADIQIIAYLVITKDSSITAHDVRKLCLDNLPNYAVPSVFYQLDELPISGSKKRQTSDLGKTILGKPLTEKLFSLTKEESVIATAFHEVLGEDLPNFGPDDSFFDFGGSLQLLVLRSEIELQTGVLVPIESMYQDATVSGLAKIVSQIAQGVQQEILNSVDVVAEAAAFSLPKSSEDKKTDNDEQVVLLTGATGFVGSHVLCSLLSSNDVDHVICLIRGDDEQSASKRLKRTILDRLRPSSSKWELWQNKLTIAAGDIGKDRLGFTPDTYNHLAKKITSVIHCAAEVNWIKPYASLKQINVEGAFNVLSLCCAAGASALFLSTVPANGAPSGYHYTKLVSEALCNRFREEAGIDTRVIRCGDMAPPITELGEIDYNTEDYIVLLLQACLELGRWPADVEWKVNLAPVDKASEAIVASAASAGPDSKPYTALVNHRDTDWRQICRWIQDELPSGSFKETNFQEFRATVKNNDESVAVQRVHLILQGSLDDLEQGPSLDGLDILPEFHTPPVDRSYITRIAKALTESQQTDKLRLSS